MTPEVEAAVEEIRCQFPEVSAVPDGNGGAYVTISSVSLSAKFMPRKVWVKFQIVPTYPAADVYPHFIQPDVRIVNATHPEGNPLGEATSVGSYTHGNDTFTAIQLSRKSNNFNPTIDTALLKLLKIIDWLENKS